MGTNVQYARGSEAWGICQRCGLRALLNELVFDRYYPGLRVHPECFDDRHPQERIKPVTDPTALWKPSPEQAGLAPVLSGVQNVAQNDLTWTEADTYGAPRIESYAVYRAAGSSDAALLVNLPVIYSDTFGPTVTTLTFSDDAITGGVTYTYYVDALDSYSRVLRSNSVSITFGVSNPDESTMTLIGSTSFFTNSLSWSAATAVTYPLAEYHLFYDDDSLVVDTNDPDTLNYDDADLDPGNYTYYVKAYDDHDNSSGESNQVTLTVYHWAAAPISQSKDWRGVCWADGLSLFVAVANASAGSQCVMTSSDGKNWTLQSTGLHDGWTSVVWADSLGLLVACGIWDTNRIMTSPDGVNWTERTTPNSDSYWNICWSPDVSLLVVVGNSGSTRVMTSSNGAIWTARTASEQNSWLGVCWADSLGLFVAVANSGTHRVMTSPDGVTWTNRTAAAANEWRSIAWSSTLGLLVAVAASGSGNRVMTSPDGINWTSRVSAADSQWDSVCWADSIGLFIAVSAGSEGAGMVMVSADGINWSLSDDGVPTQPWDSVCFSPSLGLACAIASGAVSASENVMISRTG